MHWLIKLLLIAIILAFGVGGLNLWHNTYLLGSLYSTGGPMIAIFGALAPIVGIAGAGYLIKQIVKA